MFEIYIAKLNGLLLGFHYTNEHLEQIETIDNELRHTVQVALFVIMININWYTKI